jgi:membrane peptidoglycan carboxypeptidase
MPSPRKWSPINPGRKLARRRDNILMRMRRSGYLTEEAEEELSQEEAQPPDGNEPSPVIKQPAAVSTATPTVPL